MNLAELESEALSGLLPCPAWTLLSQYALTAQGSSNIHVFFHPAGAAGNFLCPASALSFNAFKAVIDIDTLGTFNVSHVVYEKFFRVSVLWLGPPLFWQSAH